MNSKLTNQVFWKKYWATKKSVKVITDHLPLHNLFVRELSNSHYQTMIEIGGFPGHYAVYFRKFHHLTPSLLDYIVDLKLFRALLKVNDLTSKDIKLIKEDFFNHRPINKYDLVFSLGFIEHFEDTKDVIKRHWDLVKPHGKLIIGIPNFLGFNGKYQQIFDPDNLKIHNLNSMNYSVLSKIASNLKPKKCKIEYIPGKLVWLENLGERPVWLQILTYALNLTGAILTLLGINTRLTATHIFLIMEKK